MSGSCLRHRVSPRCKCPEDAGKAGLSIPEIGFRCWRSNVFISTQAERRLMAGSVVVTGLDAENKAVVLFDSGLTLKPAEGRPPLANLWTTNSVPAGFS